MNINFASAYKQLQPVERTFVDNYVADVETAAVKAGERLHAMIMRPAAVADDRSRQMLERPLVRAAIAERVKDISDAMELSAHRVIKELSAIAFSSIGNYMEVAEDGQPYFDMTKCTPEQLSAIASIEIEDNPRGARKFKFKLHDKIAGLDKFMRYMGLLDADNPHWRGENARAINADAAATLPAHMTDDAAADAYARMING